MKQARTKGEKIMFSRKVFVIALLAVVLLGSSMDGMVSLDKSRRRRPRAMVESAIAQVDQTLQQASFTKLVNQVASGITAVDPASLLAGRTDRKPRRHRVSVDGVQIAGYAKTLDNTGRLQG
jgi:hypothetical protein